MPEYENFCIFHQNTLFKLFILSDIRLCLMLLCSCMLNRWAANDLLDKNSLDFQTRWTRINGRSVAVRIYRTNCVSSYLKVYEIITIAQRGVSSEYCWKLLLINFFKFSSECILYRQRTAINIEWNIRQNCLVRFSSEKVDLRIAQESSCKRGNLHGMNRERINLNQFIQNHSQTQRYRLGYQEFRRDRKVNRILLLCINLFRMRLYRTCFSFSNIHSLQR